MPKKITLVVPGAGDGSEARDAPIERGNTADDLIRAAGKDVGRWQIQLRRGEEYVSVSGRDELFSKVDEGEKVFLVPKDMVVG